MYEAPVAKKVEFDYKENIVASNTVTKESTKCPTDPCGQNDYPPMPKPSRYGPWGFCWW